MIFIKKNARGNECMPKLDLRIFIRARMYNRTSREKCISCTPLILFGEMLIVLGLTAVL